MNVNNVNTAEVNVNSMETPEACSGCFGRTVHHTCGKSPAAPEAGEPYQYNPLGPSPYHRCALVDCWMKKPTPTAQNDSYDPTSPEVKAGIAKYMSTHKHQFNCAICGAKPEELKGNPSPKPNDSQELEALPELLAGVAEFATTDGHKGVSKTQAYITIEALIAAREAQARREMLEAVEAEAAKGNSRRKFILAELDRLRK